LGVDFWGVGCLVVTGDVGGSLYLWDGNTGEALGPLAETGKTFSVLKISPDGKEVFASSRGADGGTASIYQLDPENPKSRDLPVKSNRLTSGDWNRTSDLLAFSDGATQSIEIWNPKTQTQVIAMKSRGRPVTNAAFFTDPELIQVGFTILPEGVVDLGHEKLTHVFDFQNLKLRKILPQDTDQVSETYNAEEFLQVKRSSDPGRRGSTLQIPGGIEIKVAERSNQIRDWSYTSKDQLLVAHDFGLSLYSAKGEELRKFRGHEATVRGVASSFDGKYAVSGSEDRTGRLWNLETGDLLASLVVGDPDLDEWICWTPDGYFSMSGKGGELVGWHFNKGDDKLAKFLTSDQLFEHFFRPDVIKRSVIERKKSTEVAAQLKLEFDLKKAQEEAPTVEIVGLAEEEKASTKVIEITVKATNNGSDVREVRLFFQGKAIDPEGPGEVKGKEISIPYQVSLVSGANKFKAVAVNVDGVESKPKEVEIEYEGVKATSKLHLLAVGLNDYHNNNYDLEYCRADAQALLGQLKANATGLFLESLAVEVYDADATKPSIEKAFQQVADAAKGSPQDVFVFFYAGHGVMGETPSLDDEQFHLIPHDVDQMYGNPLLLKDKAISANLLKEMCQSIDATKQLLVIDACQSGGLLEKFSFAVRGAAEEKAIADLARSTGTLVLTATGRDKFAREATELGHGLFSFALLSALRGDADNNADRQITVFEVYSWITQNLPELSLKHTGKQQIAHGFIYGTDFPLGLVNAPTVSQK